MGSQAGPRSECHALFTKSNHSLSSGPQARTFKVECLEKCSGLVESLQRDLKTPSFCQNQDGRWENFVQRRQPISFTAKCRQPIKMADEVRAYLSLP